MKIGIMQPYFLPYIGYWQLLKLVDKFIIYDNIQYSKKGWISRNRFLRNGSPHTFSLPIEKASSKSDILDRVISKDFIPEKFLRQIEGAYSRSKYFGEVIPLFSEIVYFNDKNLFSFLYNSVIKICNVLSIDTSKIIISSTIPINHNLKSEKKVIEICKALDASVYVNPISGEGLYDKAKFKSTSIDLKFIKPILSEYPQFGNSFVGGLSILDIMMFNSSETINNYLFDYKLI